jgi:hypothetical protein
MIDNDRPMPTSSKSFQVEPLRAKLSDADARIRLNHWMPRQQGIAPRIRIGRRGSTRRNGIGAHDGSLAASFERERSWKKYVESRYTR